MPLKYGLGRHPHTLAQIANLRAHHSYPGSVSVTETVIQPIGRLRNQRSTPSCVGQAVAAAAEALTGFDGSAINLWTDARRRQGDLADPSNGTTAETAIESLIQRGLDPYEPFEEDRTDAQLSEMPSLASELEADDNRLRPDVTRYIITGSIAAQRLAIVAALQAGHGVLWATGVKDPFFALGPGDVATTAHVGANYNGHEMRFFAYDKLLDHFLVQNSWGEEWGGAAMDGVDYPGCFRIEAKAAIASAWDTLVVDLRSRVA